jgi:hypothetical protein
MKAAHAAAWLGLLLLTWPRLLMAQHARGAAPSGLVSLSVRVVDVAADRAYVEPGTAEGLRVGDEVRFERGRFKVAAATRDTAVLVLGKERLGVGARGSATVPSDRPEHVVLALARPAPLATFRGDWHPGPPPAATQTPDPVPLKAVVHSPNRLEVQDSFYAALPLEGPGRFVGNELRGRLHYEPVTSEPLGLDADIAAQTFAGDGFSLRPGAAARQVLRVRQLSVAYGRSGEFRGALGRLRGASTLVGQLDGVRLEAPLAGPLRLSAFGGSSPQTFNGMISSELVRFGSELVYDDAPSPWRPRVVVGAHASRFQGALDERKVYGAVDLMPGASRVGGHAEVSFFDARNPFNARPAELTAAGLDGDFAFGAFHVGGRADMRRPDRSRYLLSLLPLEWLCWSDPALASAPCKSGNAYYSWLLDTGARVGKFSVDLGGQSAYTTGTDATNFGGFANLRFLDLVGRTHLDLGMWALSGSLERVMAATVAPGIVLAGGDADVSVRYRAAAARYRADLGFGYEQSVGAGLWASPHPSVDFDLEGDWLRERGLSAVVLQGVVAWRLGR